MNWKKIAKALLFPPLAVVLILLPVATAALIYAMVYLTESDPLRIVSYMLAFYTLTILSARVPRIVRFCRDFKEENRYVHIWTTDARLRMNVTLSANVLWNGAYGALQLGLGIYDRSAWYYALAAYYLLLAVMRFFLVRHTLRHKPGEKMRRELIYYRRCGWIFLIINLALSGMMLYRIRQNRLVAHHEVITISMAAYTFTTLTLAIVNVVRYRKYNSPAMSASKAISLTAACVSMLSLESTMLATFSADSMREETKLLFLALSGAGISVLIITMAIYMIVQANRKLKNMEKEHGK